MPLASQNDTELYNQQLPSCHEVEAGLPDIKDFIQNLDKAYDQMSEELGERVADFQNKNDVSFWNHSLGEMQAENQKLITMMEEIHPMLQDFRKEYEEQKAILHTQQFSVLTGAQACNEERIEI